MDISFFGDSTGISTILENAVDDYCEAEDCCQQEIYDHEIEMVTVDDFIDDALEDEIITDEDIDIVIGELYEEMEKEKMQDAEEQPDCYSDDAEILNPFTDKMTVTDYLNDF